jgi:hypothetical protein
MNNANIEFGNRSKFDERSGTLTIRYKLGAIKHKAYKFEVLKSNDEGDCWVAVGFMGSRSKRNTLRAITVREGQKIIDEQLRADMAACTRLGFVCGINKDAGILTIRTGNELGAE